MKKILSLLLAFVLMVALAACGKKDTPTTGNATADSSRTQPATSTAPPVPTPATTPVDAYADVPEDFSFFYSEYAPGEITVEQYTGTNSIVRIPSEFDGMPVTTIGNDQSGVFSNSVNKGENIEVVIIPEGTVIIESWALKNLSNLKVVVFPSTLKSIEDMAIALGERFAPGQLSLKDIVFPEGLWVIGNAGFESDDTATITIPDNLRRLDPGAFAWCPNLQLVYRGVTYSPEVVEYGDGDVIAYEYNELSELIAANFAAESQSE